MIGNILGKIIEVLVKYSYKILVLFLSVVLRIKVVYNININYLIVFLNMLICFIDNYVLKIYV